MKSSRIQTLHSQTGKTKKNILWVKNEFIKENIISILSNCELTPSELTEAPFSKVKDNFEGGIQWYGETVKLDLKARQIIERTKKKPEKYKLKKTSGSIKFDNLQA